MGKPVKKRERTEESGSGRNGRYSVLLIGGGIWRRASESYYV